MYPVSPQPALGIAGRGVWHLRSLRCASSAGASGMAGTKPSVRYSARFYTSVSLFLPTGVDEVMCRPHFPAANLWFSVKIYKVYVRFFP